MKETKLFRAELQSFSCLLIVLQIVGVANFFFIHLREKIDTKKVMMQPRFSIQFVCIGDFIWHNTRIPRARSITAAINIGYLPMWPIYGNSPYEKHHSTTMIVETASHICCGRTFTTPKDYNQSVSELYEL